MLIVDVIPSRVNPLGVPLFFLNFWIQLYDVLVGFMTEVVGRQLGDFFGKFLLYDKKNDASLWREYMRIRVRIDVRKPLKRKKKITTKSGKEYVVHCKYEHLGDLCFVCGMLSHTERRIRNDTAGNFLIIEGRTW